ncbi:hypothetical protein PN36_31765 [Candidatus Thiomargarita nelsonii]|uniref:Uncharacterized protein n=1 Tax=Candidatus Thiomargarita nelsonii TaxID=1003181 RepID=A0A4E0QKE4_9GAMM|nr:hypothetical protein PN36_31765 [Candidatus Thiomargarita nelsonii]
MNKLNQKMIKIEKYLQRQKGEFKLFALFLRDGSLWDVFASETLSAINQFMPVGKKIAEIHDNNFFCLDIKQAFFFSPSRKKSLQ